jgi:hypothetical protein
LSQWFRSANPDHNITDLHHNDDLDPVAIRHFSVIPSADLDPDQNITDPEPDPNIDPDP